MYSRVENVSGSGVFLPLPWQRLLKTNEAVVIAMEPHEVEMYLGGQDVFKGVLRVTPVSEASPADLPGIPPVVPRIWFRGGVVSDLVDDNTVGEGRAKVGTRLDAARLRVAGGSDPYIYYTPGQEASLECDGVHPPTVEVIRFQDLMTGQFFLMSIQNGTVTLVPVP